MSEEYFFVSIDIRLQTPDGEDSHVCYRQVIPISVLVKNDYNWLAKIIAIVNKLEVPNV
jgi:hypothetical protein